MTRAATLALVAVAALHGGTPPVARAADDVVVVRAGAVHTGAGEVYTPGVVVVRGRVVEAVGKAGTVDVPAGALEVDAGASASVVPGFVLAWSTHLPGAGKNPRSVTPDVRAIDGYDFARDETALLAAGVTTLMIAPGSTQVVAGRAAVVKTAGEDAERRTLRADAGLVVAVGNAAQQPPNVIDPPDLPDATDAPIPPHVAQLPSSRAGAVMLVRRMLDAAREGAETARGVARGEATLWLGAESSGDLRASLDMVQDQGLRVVVVGGHEALPHVERLRDENVPVVFTWPGTPGSVARGTDVDGERRRLRAGESLLALAESGSGLAVSGANEASLSEASWLLAGAVRAGVTPAKALTAMTSGPASLLGVSDRVGALAPGKDADFVVLSGAPGELRSTPLRTFVDGREVWSKRAGGGTTIVRAAEVHVGDGTVLSPGEIAFQDGRVAEVGPTVGVPPGARWIDLGEGAVIPGLIDALSHAGLAGADGRANVDLDVSTAAADAVDPADPAFGLLAERGVTTVLAAPGGGGRVVGRTSVVKTYGPWPGERVVRHDAGILVRIAGERDVAAAVKQVSAAIKKARGYRTAHEKYVKDLKAYNEWKKKRDDAEKKRKEEEEKKKKEQEKAAKPEKPGETKPEPKPAPENKPQTPPKPKAPSKPEPEKKEPVKPAKDDTQEGWAPVLDGKVPLLVRADALPELRAALNRIAKKEKVKVVIVGGAAARRVFKEIGAAKAGVIASGPVMGGPPDRRVNRLRELALTELPRAVGSSSYLGGADLMDVLAYAVRHGLSPAAAVRLGTGDAARLLGVDDRCGLLAPGRDADLVLLTAPPFESGAAIDRVFVRGEEVANDDL